MNIEVISHAGWGRNLRIANGSAELIVTLDVGPRILSYRTHEGENVFKTYDEQLGNAEEAEWMIRGGHRFWVAPEHEDLSYHIDNERVEFRMDETTGRVLIDSELTKGARLMKTLGIKLAGETSGVVVDHQLTNTGDEEIDVAPWALSVMKSGGIEIIPQPPLGEHPRDLLPNRGIILWPYTDLSDPRWHFGREIFTLRQMEGFPPTKLGLPHREKWIAYVVEDSVFVKAFDHIEDVAYPDGGCSFETFANSAMLEIESLGPLVRLAPGDSVAHSETWHVFPIPGEAQIESEEALRNWLTPFLAKAGL